MKTKYAAIERSHLSKSVNIVDLPLCQYEINDAIIPLRNLILCCIAAQYGDEIILGATKGDRVLDKSHIFASLTTGLFQYLYSPQHWIPSGRDVRVVLPYKDMTKKEIIKRAIESGASLKQICDDSFSCYFPTRDGMPCGNCKPCFRKWVALACCGYYPETFDAAGYIQREIIPLIKNGSYDRSPEEIHDILYAMGQLEE
jgi:7-cyano-7-deazaguanine synthase in queuosine biosynthesis